jgi:membrane fusion protein (multidrug efflux system)
MKTSRLQTLILLSIPLGLSGRDADGQKSPDEAKKVTVAAVRSRDVTIAQPYLCEIRARRHIEVRTLTKGRIAAIPVKEGQAVKRGDLLFQLDPPKDEAKQDAKKYDKTSSSVEAPFDGRVGRLLRKQGSVVLEGERLTTLSDNSVMWAYFRVPESGYLEYMAERGEDKRSPEVELTLPDGGKFPRAGKIGAIDANFDENTGTVAFRADFPNPDGVLRHGQSGTVRIKRELKDAVVVPQRATFETLDKRYVYVVGEDHVAHRREIVIQHETDDLFVVKQGVRVGDEIVLEGVRLVRDGGKVE